MTKEHPAIRLAKAEDALKRLETRAKRINTAIKTRKRSITALRRSAAKAGPVPAPEPKAPKPRRIPDPTLAELNEWGRKAASVLRVKAPKVRWVGTKGACKRAARAHIHTRNTGHYVLDRKTFRQVYIKTPRGTCCVNKDAYGFATREDRSERMMSLMAHEVSHLVRRHGHGNGHGAKFQSTMKHCLEALGKDSVWAERAAAQVAAEALEEVPA